MTDRDKLKEILNNPAFTKQLLSDLAGRMSLMDSMFMPSPSRAQKPIPLSTKPEGKVVWDRGATEGSYTTYTEVRQTIRGMPEVDPETKQRIRKRILESIHYKDEYLWTNGTPQGSVTEIPIDEQQTLIIPVKRMK